MGSSIILNDTLQLTAVQGFPKELSLERHLKQPFTAKNFLGRVFSFHNKSGIRIYQTPPVRNFLVENRKGKWIYWGLCEVLSVTHDNRKKVTSGTFRILYIYTPEEMKQAHALVDHNSKTSFF